MTPTHRDISKEITKTSPLPPIGKSRESSTVSRASAIKIPAKVPIVLVVGEYMCTK